VMKSISQVCLGLSFRSRPVGRTIHDLSIQEQMDPSFGHASREA
jgi:hypothetical protein